MTTHLLDANVLIALAVAEHEHHDRSRRWVSDVDAFAVCPVVEGALVRFLVRLGESVTAAQTVASGFRNHQRCHFWTDTLSYTEVDLGHVRGHRQVTDAYLAALATANGGRLATLDHALADTLPGSVTLLPS